MDGRKQGQQVNSKKLSGGVLSMPATGPAVGSAVISKIV